MFIGYSLTHDAFTAKNLNSISSRRIGERRNESDKETHKKKEQEREREEEINEAET